MTEDDHAADDAADTSDSSDTADTSSTSITRVRSVAVHREDVATALEAALRTDRRVVLRITPPFAGRMRGRIHEVGEAEGAGGPGGEDGGAVHLDPRDLVDDPPPYPEVDETAADHPDADLSERRERHAEAVAAWRDAVQAGVTDSVVVEREGAAHEIRVAALG